MWGKGGGEAGLAVEDAVTAECPPEGPCTTASWPSFKADFKEGDGGEFTRALEAAI